MAPPTERESSHSYSPKIQTLSSQPPLHPGERRSPATHKIDDYLRDRIRLRVHPKAQF
ncbi:MAG: hypothetical protein QNJ46_01690 [Leptolyngbyaceae cyanobacterium MO_188.B28]|nr:hypothetical protein [Leptolyngbyaceae cyanobacterium MO_188.B28]